MFKKIVGLCTSKKMKNFYRPGEIQENKEWKLCRRPSRDEPGSASSREGEKKG